MKLTPPQWSKRRFTAYDADGVAHYYMGPAKADGSDVGLCGANLTNFGILVAPLCEECADDPPEESA